jgi:hypothetical protein
LAAQLVLNWPFLNFNSVTDGSTSAAWPVTVTNLTASAERVHGDEWELPNQPEHTCGGRELHL